VEIWEEEKINKLVQDSEGNERNTYPDPYSNKTKINCHTEHNEDHKNILKENILQVITENFMEMLLDMVNQNIQGEPTKCPEEKNKEYEK
jgi:hypothetical protein